MISGLVALLLIVLSGACLLRPSIRARYLFHELETLQLGYSTFEDAQKLAKKIDASVYGPCDRSGCTWEKRIDNGQLPRWWRGSGEVFEVGFTVKNSLVTRKYTGFGIEGARIDAFSPSAVWFDEQEHWGTPDRGNMHEPVAAGWSTTDLFRYYRFSVRMTPYATAEERRRYTAFDYTCMWRYRGCKDARELLPTADSFPSANEKAAPSRNP